MSTAIAEQKNNTAPPAERPTTIKGWLQSEAFKAEVAKAMPRHADPDRLMRIAITALTRTPKLQECDQGSFMKCLLDLSQWGLEPDGRHAHLIPFYNGKRKVTECQLILDYKGIVQLIYRTGKISTVYTACVYEGDLFEYSMGILTDHKPWYLRNDPQKPREQGKLIAAVCRVVFKDGTARSEVMSKDEIDAVRNRSKAKSSGPWVTDYPEMAKKTVFRRASKWLPVSAEMVEAMERDYDTLANKNSSVVIDSGAPALTLDDLADRIAESDDTEEVAEESADSEPDQPDTLDPIIQAGEEIEACERMPALNDLDAKWMGPESTLDANQRKYVGELIAKRRKAIADAATQPGESMGADGELFETGDDGEGVGQ